MAYATLAIVPIVSPNSLNLYFQPQRNPERTAFLTAAGALAYRGIPALRAPVGPGYRSMKLRRPDHGRYIVRAPGAELGRTVVVARGRSAACERALSREISPCAPSCRFRTISGQTCLPPACVVSTQGSGSDRRGGARRPRVVVAVGRHGWSPAARVRSRPDALALGQWGLPYRRRRRTARADYRSRSRAGAWRTSTPRSAFRREARRPPRERGRRFIRLRSRGDAAPRR